MNRSVFGDYCTALRAEHIKKKGTGIYGMSAAIGWLFPVVLCLFAIVRKSEINEAFEFSYYMKFVKDASSALTNFFLPLLIIVIASRIAQLDHRNGGWQLMETQPLRKFALYFGKFSVVLISCLIAILSLLVGGVLCGWIMSWFIEIPDNAMMHIPWMELLQWGSRLFLAALYMAAFQYLIAVLVPSFIWSILIGFGLLLMGSFIKLYGYNFDWYPYHIMSRITDFKSGSDLGHWFVYTEYVSLFAAVVLLYIGFQWYRHKGWRRAFFAKPKRTVALGGVLVLGGVALYGLLRPGVGDTYSRTVLAGEIETLFSIQQIYVINPTLDDTLAVIPVTGNRFHHVFAEPLVADDYQLEYDRYYRTQAYFGQQDSIYITANTNEQASNFSVTGTRLADNQAPRPGQPRSRMGYYLQQNLMLDNPQRFAEILHDDWRRSQRQSRLFKTVDNLTPKSDFNQRSSKLAAVSFLNFWTEYIRKRQAAFPDEPTDTPEEITAIQTQVSLNDEALLSHPAYQQYVVSQFILSDTTDTPQHEKALNGIAALADGRFKDKLLYRQLAQSLEDATDSLERQALLDRYGTLIADGNYHDRAVQVYAKWQRLGKGGDAPHFDAVDLVGNSVSLGDLEGQPAVIDIWASWCAPCKFQSPYFERLAIKYKDKPIHFVALNVDRSKGKWEIDVASNSKTVKQWHVLDIEKFGLDYNATTIPRFILIDADGRFVSAQMPMPSESAFELIVRNTLGLSD